MQKERKPKKKGVIVTKNADKRKRRERNEAELELWGRALHTAKTEFFKSGDSNHLKTLERTLQEDYHPKNKRKAAAGDDGDDAEQE